MTTLLPLLDESLNSSFYEQLVEHKFISELLQEACFRYGKTIEVLRSEVDAYGYDLVLEYQGVIRHVQLKTSKPDSSTSNQSVALRLTQKENWCVVWVRRSLPSADKRRIELSYSFFGTQQDISPDLQDYAVTLHTRKGKDNLRQPREGHRKVHKREFIAAKDMEELFKLLFPQIASE